MKQKSAGKPILFVLGTRGFPNVQGGVETHCENLYPRLAAKGWDVVVARRRCYLQPDAPRQWRGVRFVDLYAPRSKKFEAIVHSFLAVLKARSMGAKIVHIHAIGPWLVAPVARMLGMRVVCTHHGSDYRRDKWGRMAKMMLKTGEKFGARWADSVIVISTEIANTLRKLYGRSDTKLIYNGVPQAEVSTSTDYLQNLGVEPEKFVLALGRFVPEKNFHLLVKAFAGEMNGKCGQYKLVIAGDADHPDEYSERLKRDARDAGVVLTGFVKGEKLRQLLSNARLFVLPSSHEGLPISLLEAMSYGRDVLVSDVEANCLPELMPGDIFSLDNAEENLRVALRCKLSEEVSLPRHYDMSNYNWDTIADQTDMVYRLK